MGYTFGTSPVLGGANPGRAVYAPRPATLSNGMSAYINGAVLPHRGGGLSAPDNELAGMEFGYSYGARIVECDVICGSDGTPVVIHDDTVNRTTTTTGDVDALDIAGVRALVTDPGAYTGAAGWPNAGVPTLDDVLQRFKGRSKFFIEAKDAAAGEAILGALVRNGVGPADAVVNASVLTFLAHLKAAGYSTVQNVATVATQEANFPVFAAAGASAIMGGAGWTAALVSRCHELGMLAGLYGISRKKDMDDFLALGGDFILADEPGYLMGYGLNRAGDQFAGGLWPHGVIPYATDNGGRGRVTIDGAWQQTWLDINPRMNLLGFLGRTVNTAPFRLKFKLGIDSSRAANASYHLMLCTPTDEVRNGFASQYGTGGLFVVLRRTQQYSVYLIGGPSTITLLGETSAQSALSGTGTGADSDGDQSAAAGTGTQREFEITFNPMTGTLTLANLTAPHPVTPTLTITDARMVGLAGYIHAGRNNVTSTIPDGFQLIQ